jgi:hypothetical protein
MKTKKDNHYGHDVFDTSDLLVSLLEFSSDLFVVGGRSLLSSFFNVCMSFSSLLLLLCFNQLSYSWKGELLLKTGGVVLVIFIFIFFWVNDGRSHPHKISFF